MTHGKHISEAENSGVMPLFKPFDLSAQETLVIIDERIKFVERLRLRLQKTESEIEELRDWLGNLYLQAHQQEVNPDRIA